LAPLKTCSIDPEASRLALRIGATRLQSCNLTPTHFHGVGRPFRGHDDSFGESPLAQSIDTFRNSTPRNGSMGSFGQTDSREKSPVYATHSPEFAIGFVSKNGHWLRSGKAHSPGASTLFGTQHIITDQWVRLVKPVRGRRRPFVRPILPSLPLASFRKTVNWLALKKK
jgi:hypothetical protein